MVGHPDHRAARPGVRGRPGDRAPGESLEPARRRPPGVDLQDDGGVGYWRRGDAAATEAVARATLAGFDVELHAGWIPERFSEIVDGDFCFVTVDVDLHAPTRDSIEFFYPRMVPGGVMLFDDYGSGFQSPGTAKAIDDFMADKPESVIASPTAQAFIVKR